MHRKLKNLGQRNASKHLEPTPPEQPTYRRKSADSIFGSLKQGAGSTAVPTLNQTVHQTPQIPKQEHKLRFVTDDSTRVDTLHGQNEGTTSCNQHICSGSIMVPQDASGQMSYSRSKETVFSEARKFLEEYYGSKDCVADKSLVKRLAEVEKHIKSSKTYDMTYDELKFAAKMAWRNAARCIGRIHWSNMMLLDARDVKTADGMFKALCTHLEYATNGGNIRPAITVFAQRTKEGHDFRVWNSQLIRYAGYRQPDGTVIGDPASADLTEECQKLGWRGEGGMFDILPLVLQAGGEKPKWFEIPRELALEVHMKHPQYPWFESLGLRWYAVPAVANMMLDCGGLQFSACPFNGWYMSTEIGARDFCDEQRYNLLPLFGQRMGLDVDNITSLWKDRALVEVNIAVLYSFQKASVTISDHHSASESFMLHMRNEYRLRGGCPADWVWIVPPMSGSICPVFHQEMLRYHLKPSYEYQNDPWEVTGTRPRQRVRFVSLARLMITLNKWNREALRRRQPVTILFASETGRSEALAKRLWDRFKYAFNPRVICMNDYNPSELKNESLLLVVTSTFREGDPPSNGEKFHRELLRNIPKLTSGKHRFSVFALGSRAYPDFCQFGKDIDRMFEDIGMSRIFPLAEGDELNGQERSYLQWAEGVYMECCSLYDVQTSNIADDTAVFNAPWHAGKFRLRQLILKPEVSVRDGLKQLHGVNVSKAHVIKIEDLYEPKQDRSTFLVRLETNNDPVLDYEPGDHLVVYPKNAPEVVNPILDRITETTDYEYDTPGTIEMLETDGDKQSWRGVQRIPTPLSISTALDYFLDVTTPLGQDLLAALASMATGKQDRQTLKHLSMNDEAYEQWRWEHQPTLADILTRFPSVVLDPAFLFCQLPVLQPRSYSISSSPSCYNGQLHVTVGEMTYTTPDGKIHHGVCSTFLRRLQEDSGVICRINHAPKFRLPEDPTSPVILVGAGTGIAPFRSFWQERLVQMARRDHGEISPRRNPMLNLYQGCRSSDELTYSAELAEMEHIGVMDTHIAFSRQPDTPKIYVQDLLRQDGEDVVDIITKQSGDVYVCGDVTISSAVVNTLVDLLAKHSALNKEDAMHFIRLMKEQDRFHEDIFSSSKAPPGPMVPVENVTPLPQRKSVFQNDSNGSKSSSRDWKQAPSLRRHVKKKKHVLERGASYIQNVFPKWKAKELHPSKEDLIQKANDPRAYLATIL